MSNITIPREVVEQALQIMEEVDRDDSDRDLLASDQMEKLTNAIDALRAALSAAAEPVKSAQTVEVPHGWRPNEEQFQSWLERYFVHPTDRDAFFDAASLYLTASPSPAPAVPDAAKPDAFDPQNNCEKNHSECEAPELCGKYGHCMGA